MLLQRDRRSCAPLTPTPEILLWAARVRHGRRALEEAAEHGAALLQALGLPRIVLPDFEPIDPAEVGAALDAVIAALDEADAPAEDLEDEGHAEPSLGWCERVAQDHIEDGRDDEETLGWSANVSQLALAPNTEDGEHTLGAPERHPFTLTMTARCFEPADGQHVRRHRRDGSQTMWAQGARQDGEGEAEPGYDLPEGDDERCASGEVDAEPSIGWPEDFTAKLDSERQILADSDREADPLADDASWSADQRAELVRGRRTGAALVERAKAIRRGGSAPKLDGGNLVLVDLRVIGVRGLPWADGKSWVGGRVHG